MNGWKYILFIFLFPFTILLLFWFIAWAVTRLWFKGPSIGELSQDEDGGRLERELEKPHDDERD